MIIGDFNAKSSIWFCEDKKSFKDDPTENLISQFRLHQIIKEPAHILDTSSSNIELIFRPQPNLIIKSGIHSFVSTFKLSSPCNLCKI